MSSFPITANGMADADIALGGIQSISLAYLEKCNQTNYAHFKSDLIYSAYGDNWTGTLPNFDFGNGKLDAFQTLINGGINDTTIQSACDRITVLANIHEYQ